MPTQHEPEAEVLATVHAFLNAWMQPVERAVEDVLAHVAEDFTGIGTGPGDYYPDRDAFRALIQRERGEMPYPSTLETPWMNACVVHPALAVVEGQIRSEIYAEAETHVVEPRYTLVLERRGGRWLLVHVHFSFPHAMQSEGGTLMDALEGRNRELEREVAQRTAALERSLADLRVAQARLVQQEKMASLGRLTAGIAHEIKNPLNFVNNFATLACELAEELETERDPAEARTILGDLKVSAQKIEEHGRRADGIIHAMLNHARGGGERRPVDLNGLVAEYADLAWHGTRAEAGGLDVELVKDLGATVGQAEVIPEAIGRVVLNLVSNAFDAVRERAAQAGGPYAPRVTVTTRRAGGQVAIRVSDNGPGIPEDVRARIFEPFFTTKPAGQGTGLGLSLSYDIVVQGHGGALTVESEGAEGATFVATLPVDDGHSMPKR